VSHFRINQEKGIISQRLKGTKVFFVCSGLGEEKTELTPASLKTQRRQDEETKHRLNRELTIRAILCVLRASA
jgi:hypothetical protein